MMGFSYDSDDGPKMCFNAVKNFQLGWYERMKQSYYPLSHINRSTNFVLVGVDGYRTSGDTQGKLVTLRVVEDGDRNGRDYYVGYNDAIGVNSGTLEGRNQVLVFQKPSGGPNGYGTSDRIAELNVGNSYTIRNLSNQVDVTIRFISVGNGGRDANVEIITSGDGPPAPVPAPTRFPTNFPTQPPVPSPTRFPTNFPTQPPVPSPTRFPTNFPTQPPVPSPTRFPTNFPTQPPVPSPTRFPTNFPTQPPVLAPTQAPNNNLPVCNAEDESGVVFRKPRGRSRNKKCKWVRNAKNLKTAGKRCNKSYEGASVQDRCPVSCGRYAGVGSCAFLFEEGLAGSKNKNNRGNKSPILPIFYNGAAADESPPEDDEKKEENYYN
jgi:hypothetical protein